MGSRSSTSYVRMTVCIGPESGLTGTSPTPPVALSICYSGILPHLGFIIQGMKSSFCGFAVWRGHGKERTSNLHSICKQL